MTDLYDVNKAKEKMDQDFFHHRDILRAIYGVPMIFLGRDLELFLVGILVGIFVLVLGAS